MEVRRHAGTWLRLQLTKRLSTCPPDPRFGAKAATWKPVDQSLTLGQLLDKEEYVIPGIPLLFAVAKGTEFRARFLAEKLR